MKFRKKSVVIDAEQFKFPYSAESFEAQRDYCERLGVKIIYDCEQVKNKGLGLVRFQIETLEGPHIVSDGDWIIRGIKGELYPCKPDIFEATYEPVGE